MRCHEFAKNPNFRDLSLPVSALGKYRGRRRHHRGRRLTLCKDELGHGNWLPGIEREFGWTEMTATRFINVHKLASKFENFSNLDLPVRGLYLLAAPSTPDEARDRHR